MNISLKVFMDEKKLLKRITWRYARNPIGRVSLAGNRYMKILFWFV
jgi:hypothetical protein